MSSEKRFWVLTPKKNSKRLSRAQTIVIWPQIGQKWFRRPNLGMWSQNFWKIFFIILTQKFDGKHFSGIFRIFKDPKKVLQMLSNNFHCGHVLWKCLEKIFFFFPKFSKNFEIFFFDQKKFFFLKNVENFIKSSKNGKTLKSGLKGSRTTRKPWNENLKKIEFFGPKLDELGFVWKDFFRPWLWFFIASKSALRSKIGAFLAKLWPLKNSKKFFQIFFLSQNFSKILAPPT